LDPRNNLAVEIFTAAASTGGVRVGDCGSLVSMIDIDRVLALLDEYSMHFPTWLARHQTLQLVLTLNGVATPLRAAEENEARKVAMEQARLQAEAEARNKRGRR